MKKRWFRNLLNLQTYLYSTYRGGDVFVGVFDESTTLYTPGAPTMQHRYECIVYEGVPTTTNSFGFILSRIEVVTVGAGIFARTQYLFPGFTSVVTLDVFCQPVSRKQKLLALVDNLKRPEDETTLVS